MTFLYRCNTVYTDPPSDVNPLFLQAYKDSRLLVLCAKEQQVARLDNHPDKNIDAFGWWVARIEGLFDSDGNLKEDFLSEYDIVVILDSHRIDPSFQPLVDQVTAACPRLLLSPII